MKQQGFGQGVLRSSAEGSGACVNGGEDFFVVSVVLTSDTAHNSALAVLSIERIHFDTSNQHPACGVTDRIVLKCGLKLIRDNATDSVSRIKISLHTVC